MNGVSLVSFWYGLALKGLGLTVHDRVVDHASRISVLTIIIELQGVERGSEN